MFQHKTFWAFLLLFSPLWCQRLQEAHASFCSISDTQVNGLFFLPLCMLMSCLSQLHILQSCYLPKELLEQSEMINGAGGWPQNQINCGPKCGWSSPKLHYCCLPNWKATGRVNNAHGTGAWLQGLGEVRAVEHIERRLGTGRLSVGRSDQVN